jgi:hypothetical protein
MQETFRNLRRLTPALSDLSVDDMAAQGSLTGAVRALVVSLPAPGFLQR